MIQNITIAHIVLSQDFFPKIGGAHTWMYEVYKRWPEPVKLITQNYKDDPILCTLQNKFDARSHGSIDISRYDIAIDDINIFSPIFFKKIFFVASLIASQINSEQYLIHCIRAFPEGVIGLLRKLIDCNFCKLIVYAHGEEVLATKTSRQLKFFGKLIYKFADIVITNSHFTNNLVKELVPASNVVTIHLGVNTEGFESSGEIRSAIREKLGWSEKTIVLTTVARLEPHKNHALTIKALAELVQEGYNICYIIIGEGSEADALMELVERLGIKKNIYFAGRVSEKEKKELIGASDIHVLPSIWGKSIEGFGLAFLEAAAAGVPSIAGNVGGQPEAVLHNKTGLVIDGRDFEALKQAIKTLVTDTKFRIKLGKNAYNWAQQHSWDKITEKTYQIIANS